VEELDKNHDDKIELEEFRKWWKTGRKGKNGTMKRLTGLEAKALGILGKANLELLREIEDDAQFVDSSISIAIGEPPSDKIGMSLTIDG